MSSRTAFYACHNYMNIQKPEYWAGTDKTFRDGAFRTIMAGKNVVEYHFSGFGGRGDF